MALQTEPSPEGMHGVQYIPPKLPKLDLVSLLSSLDSCPHAPPPYILFSFSRLRVRTLFSIPHTQHTQLPFSDFQKITQSDEYKSLMVRLSGAHNYRSMLDPSTNAMIDPETDDHDELRFCPAQSRHVPNSKRAFLDRWHRSSSVVCRCLKGWRSRWWLGWSSAYIAEVVVLAGYYRRIGEAKARE